MKEKDLLRLEHMDETVRPFLQVANSPIPRGGWLRAIRDALGMSSAQLGKRLGMQSQSIEDIQKSEVNGTIQLNTLRQVAREMGCKVVYALVPADSLSLSELRENQARRKAMQALRPVSHSMKLEAQGLSAEEEQRQLKLLTQQILAGSPRKLWG